MDAGYIVETELSDYYYFDNLEAAKEFLKKRVLEIETKAAKDKGTSAKIWSKYREDGLCADIFLQTLGVFVNGYVQLMASVKIHENKHLPTTPSPPPDLPPRKNLCGNVEIIENYQEDTPQSEYATPQAENLYTAIATGSPSGFHTGVSRLYSILPTLKPKSDTRTDCQINPDSNSQNKGSYVWV